MRSVFKQLLHGKGNFRVQSKKGKSTEIFGALLELKNPRARLSRSLSRAKLFSAIGEFFWYLAGDQSINFIKHYIPNYEENSNDGIIANGAYGPRIFGHNACDKRQSKSQWDRAISTLNQRSGSRNAVIQLYSNEDAFEGNKDKPCTCTLQFAIRKNKLLLHTHMRSNDALKGLPHDIFSFTLLQEIASRELGVGLGTYLHSVSSLHLYDDKDAIDGQPVEKSKTLARKFYAEGLHDHVPMPSMPKGDPWPSLGKLVDIEAAIRINATNNFDYGDLEPYWQDFANILQVHAIFKRMGKKEDFNPYYLQGLKDVARTARLMSSEVYRLYILDRLAKKENELKDLFDYAGLGE